MGILGFPSSAIIGNLDWTGESATLVASDTVTVNGLAGVFLYSTALPYQNPYIAISGDGVRLVTNDEGTSLHVKADGTGIYTDTQGSISFTAGEEITLYTSGGGININGENLLFNSEQVATVNSAKTQAVAMAIALG